MASLEAARSYIQELANPMGVSRIANALEGLREKREYNERIMTISGVLFLPCAIATGLGLAGKVGWLVLGFGAAGSIAFAVAFLVYKNELWYVKGWEEAIGFQGDTQSPLWHLEKIRGMIEPGALKDDVRGKAMLKKVWLNTFQILDVRESSALRDNHMSPAEYAPGFIGTVLLNYQLRFLQAQTVEAPPFDSALIGKFLKCRRGNSLSDAERYVVEELPKKSLAERQNILREIRIPPAISVGHGLVCNMLIWMAYLNADWFDEKGMIKANKDGIGIGFLKSWLSTLTKAKQWLEKDGNYGANADVALKTFIESGLKAKTMKDLHDAYSLLNDEDKKRFQRNIA